MAGVDIHSTGARHVGPYIFEPAIWSKHLDALIFAVGDINIAVTVGADVMWKTEFSRPVSRLSPRTQQAAVWCVFVNLGVAVTVGYEKLTGTRMNRHVSAAAHWLPTHSFGGLAAGPERHH